MEDTPLTLENMQFGSNSDQEDTNLKKSPKEIDIEKHSPNILVKEKNDLYLHCKTCSAECGPANIDGECYSCAIKRLRKLENSLVQRNQISPSHKFCAIEGHSEVYSNPLHPEWQGEIVINGVHLYPVFPLCKDCLDKLTTYLVCFLEERGILRKGSGNIDNKFGEPYATPLSQTEKIEAVARLTEFMSAIDLIVLDSQSTVPELMELLKSRKRIIAQTEVKEVHQWEEERKLKLPKNQLEFLELAENYYPSLKEEEEKSKNKKTELEKNFLRTRPIPEKVLEKAKMRVWSNLFLQSVLLSGSAKEVAMGKVKFLEGDVPEVADLTEQPQELVQTWMERVNEKKLVRPNPYTRGTILAELQKLLGPHADSAEEVMKMALEELTTSPLISSLMTKE